MRNLPQGWRWVSLRDLASIVGGLTKGKQRKPSDHLQEVPYLRVANVQRGRLDLREIKFIEATTAEIESLRLVQGDVLFNEGGDRDKLGRGCVWNDELALCIHQNHVFRARVTPGLSPQYVSFYGNSVDAQEYFLGSAKQTTNLASINITTLGGLPVPTPPPREQRRIVDKLEALQARSRRAREALDAVPPLLEKLRQSILAAAFRGDLTKDWRAANPNVEPATELLKRIRKERGAAWERTELTKLTAKGKPPTDDKWKAKYKEPDPVDTTGLPELPEGWCWASLELLSDASRGIPYGIVLTGNPTEDGVPTVRCGDIKSYQINIKELKRVGRDVAAAFERTRLHGGEVLIAIRGTVGATAVATEPLAGMNISREVAMIPVLSGLASRYLMYCLSAPEAKARLMGEVKGVAQSGINLADLRKLPVPVAPATEQAELLHAIEEKLGLCIHHAETCKQLELDFPRLNSSILAKAFRGELVPQDPNDEPAEAMLARLRVTSNAKDERTAKRTTSRNRFRNLSPIK